MLCATGGAIFATWGSRSDVPKEKLLLTRDEWQSRVGPLPYASEEKFIQDFTDDRTIVRRFTGQDDSGLRQEITKHANSGRARFGYWWTDPEASDRKVGTVENVSDSYTIPGPDSYEVWCGNGNSEVCESWVFWAIYGRYIMKLRMYTGGTRIEKELFVSYLMSANDHVMTELDARG